MEYMIMCVFCCIFFFKQKTAYEMRISDCSSDVCSSDLQVREARQPRADRALRLVIGRVTMPRADDHAVADEGANILLVAEFGRERQHHAPPVRRGECRQYLGIEPSDEVHFVNAALHLVAERAFDMDADDAGPALLDRCVDRSAESRGGEEGVRQSRT